MFWIGQRRVRLQREQLGPYAVHLLILRTCIVHTLFQLKLKQTHTAGFPHHENTSSQAYALPCQRKTCNTSYPPLSLQNSAKANHAQRQSHIPNNLVHSHNASFRYQAQLSNSLISSIRCIFFSSSLIIPSELALF